MTVLFEFPGQLPVSGTQLCPPTPGNHSGHLGLSFSSGFPGGAQSSTAGNVLWDLVPPSLSVTEQLHAQNQLGHSCLGPSTSRFSPIPWFTRGGSWHWALTAALGHLGCPARPAPPFPAPASGRCLHQENFIPFTRAQRGARAGKSTPGAEETTLALCWLSRERGSCSFLCGQGSAGLGM